MPIILQGKDIIKQFPGTNFPAVDHLTCSFEKSKIYCFIGENGSGKSTLLKVLAGLLDTDGGDVYLYDEKLEKPSEQLIAGHPAIKMLMQDATLYPKMNVYDNLRFELKSHPITYLNKRIEELLEMCHLQEARKKYPHELSGGQKQRIALAKTLADSPEVLILDEPFSNADLFQKEELWSAIRNIVAAEETVVIYTTHEAAEALSIPDYLYCIRNGKIVQEGTPETLYRNPSSSYVAKLTGLCNFFYPQQLGINDVEEKLIFVRPENLEVTLAEDVSLKGVITHRRFFGFTNYYLLRTEEGKSLWFLDQVARKIGDQVLLRLKEEFSTTASEDAIS